MALQPISQIVWLHHSELQPNDYNPNTVAPQEMRLLAHSLLKDGWTGAIVVNLCEDGKYVIIDGFHRWKLASTNKKVQALTDGKVPCIVKQLSLADRITSTVRHNEASGVHGVVPTAELVRKLVDLGIPDDQICKDLGFDVEMLLRMKQTAGIAAKYRNNSFTQAWVPDYSQE